jgi:homoserine kinase
VFAACVQRGVTIGAARDEARDRASELEGHADNAAASALGGLVSVAGDVAVRVPIALDASVVLWIPDGETSTRTSRTQLPDHVPFADAVFNIGRAATLVAALASGDAPALRVATQDRMHQERRFDRVPSSRAALDAMIAAGAWGAWLSGSGPTVAGLCEPGDAPAIAAALPSGGRGIISAIDRAGVRLTTTERAAPC